MRDAFGGFLSRRRRAASPGRAETSRGRAIRRIVSVLQRHALRQASPNNFFAACRRVA
jgi:hypothetical protein